jgi:biopolymer transport protein ExbD
MTLDLAPPRPRRRPSLTPMIDVVFLLLVFFMLAARFGQDLSLVLDGAGAEGAAWQGGPRLVTVLPDGLLLNGRPVAEADLVAALAPLLPDPDAPVLLRAGADTDLARLVATLDLLRDGGLPRLLLVE